MTVQWRRQRRKLMECWRKLTILKVELVTNTSHPSSLLHCQDEAFHHLPFLSYHFSETYIYMFFFEFESPFGSRFEGVWVFHHHFLGFTSYSCVVSILHIHMWIPHVKFICDNYTLYSHVGITWYIQMCILHGIITYEYYIIEHIHMWIY